MPLTRLHPAYSSLPYTTRTPDKAYFSGTAGVIEFAGFLDKSGNCCVSYQPLILIISTYCCDDKSYLFVAAYTKTSTGKLKSQKDTATWVKSSLGLLRVSLFCDDEIQIPDEINLDEYQQRLIVAFEEAESVDGFTIDQTTLWDLDPELVCPQECHPPLGGCPPGTVWVQASCECEPIPCPPGYSQNENGICVREDDPEVTVNDGFNVNDRVIFTQKSIEDVYNLDGSWVRSQNSTSVVKSIGFGSYHSDGTSQIVFKKLVLIALPNGAEPSKILPGVLFPDLGLLHPTGLKFHKDGETDLSSNHDGTLMFAYGSFVGPSLMTYGSPYRKFNGIEYLWDGIHTPLGGSIYFEGEYASPMLTFRLGQQANILRDTQTGAGTYTVTTYSVCFKYTREYIGEGNVMISSDVLYNKCSDVPVSRDVQPPPPIVKVCRQRVCAYLDLTFGVKIKVMKKLYGPYDEGSETSPYLGTFGFSIRLSKSISTLVGCQEIADYGPATALIAAFAGQALSILVDRAADALLLELGPVGALIGRATSIDVRFEVTDLDC